MPTPNTALIRKKHFKSYLKDDQLGNLQSRMKKSLVDILKSLNSQMTSVHSPGLQSRIKGNELEILF